MFAVFAVIIIALLWWSIALVPKNVNVNNRQTACTNEAKICPDGSAVGRTGPDCAFAPCPSALTNSRVAAGCVITGCSGTVCSDHEVITDCMARPTDSCYTTAVYEHQANGACGWTLTPDLQRCIVAGGLPTNTK